MVYFHLSNRAYHLAGILSRANPTLVLFSETEAELNPQLRTGLIAHIM